MRLTAVVWCDDQQALAYLQDPVALSPGAPWPTAGEVVELEVATITTPQGALRVVTRLAPHGGALPIAALLPPAPGVPLYVAAQAPDPVTIKASALGETDLAGAIPTTGHPERPGADRPVPDRAAQGAHPDRPQSPADLRADDAPAERGLRPVAALR